MLTAGVETPEYYFKKKKNPNKTTRPIASGKDSYFFSFF